MAEEDPVGAAICFRSLLAGSGWIDYGMKYHNLTTSAVGELQAIAMAVEHAVGTLPKLEESVQKQVRIEIFSNSTYALQKISGDREPESHDKVTICRDILENLRFLPVEPGRVQMFWVPAHAGNPGNERVDKKAGIASKQGQDLEGLPLAQHELAPLVWSRAQIHDPREYPHQNGEAKPGQTQTLTTVYPRMTATYELNMPFEQQSNELEDTFKILIKIHNGCPR